jgi:hypothetical protein
VPGPTGPTGPTGPAASWLTAASLSASGYQRFANNFTVQWGSISIAANTRAFYSYPISFSSAYAISSGSDWGPTGSGGWAVCGATLTSATQFIAWNAGDATNTIYWIATGSI